MQLINSILGCECRYSRLWQFLVETLIWFPIKTSLRISDFLVEYVEKNKYKPGNHYNINRGMTNSIRTLPKLRVKISEMNKVWILIPFKEVPRFANFRFYDGFTYKTNDTEAANMKEPSKRLKIPLDLIVGIRYYDYATRFDLE